MRWLVMASLGTALIAGGCGSKSSPEDSLHRFVESINGAEFNHAYQELSGRCQAETSLDRFQKTYGKTLLSYGIGGGGLAGNGSLKANDVAVARTDDYHAEVTLDWVLETSLDNPLPFQGKLFEGKLPLNTVFKVAGTPDRPLNVIDETRKGDWRIDSCDPLGMKNAPDAPNLGY